MVKSPDGNGHEWVSNKKWYDAQNAHGKGTATQEQLDLLKRGHL
jgi:hypothetical protein